MWANNYFLSSIAKVLQFLLGIGVKGYRLIFYTCGNVTWIGNTSINLLIFLEKYKLWGLESQSTLQLHFEKFHYK